MLVVERDQSAPKSLFGSLNLNLNSTATRYLTNQCEQDGRFINVLCNEDKPVLKKVRYREPVQ